MLFQRVWNDKLYKVIHIKINLQAYLEIFSELI